MLQLQFIRDNKEEVIARLKVRNFDATSAVEEVIALDEERRTLQSNLDNTLAQSKKLSNEIGDLFKTGQTEKANELKAQSLVLKEESKSLSENLNTTAEKLQSLLYTIPNLPHSSVPTEIPIKTMRRFSEKETCLF